MRTNKSHVLLLIAISSSILLVSSCRIDQDPTDRIARLEEENVSLTQSKEALEDELDERRAENQTLVQTNTTLEEQLTLLQAENQSLGEAVATLEKQRAELEARLDNWSEAEATSRAPHDGWEEYFPSFDQTTLRGETTEAVKELLGRPPYLIRSIAVNPEFSREIWVFIPYEEDPTGLYLFFQGHQLTASRLDEFQGLHRSDLLGDEDFWQGSSAH